MTFLAVWSFIKGILKAVPFWVWVALGLLIAAFLYGESRYRAGQAERQALWDAAATAEAQQRRETDLRQVDATQKVEIVYRDRIQTVTVKGDTIIKKVPVYVPVDSPDMPPGFRLLHDAAALQHDLPGEAAIATSDPASAQDVATTVADNYKTCHLYRAAVTAWETWADDQERLAGSSGGSR